MTEKSDNRPNAANQRGDRQMKTENGDERRTEPRFPVARTGKLFREQAHRSEIARTRNVSRGGALLELHGERPIAVGERVELIIAWTDEALLPRESMTSAVVVRAEATETGTQSVALRYDTPEAPHVVLDWAKSPGAAVAQAA